MGGGMNQTTQVQFCGGAGYALRCEADKARLLADMATRFGVDALYWRHERYSGKTARALRFRRGVMASVRPDGRRYLLFLTRVAFSGVCAFVERRAPEGVVQPRVILGRLAFDDAAFDDTIMDGELVQCKDGSHAFVATDMFADCGEPLGAAGLAARLDRLGAFVRTRFRPDDHDPCALWVADHVPVDQLRGALAAPAIAALPYACRGVCFKMPSARDDGEADVVFAFPQTRSDRPEDGDCRDGAEDDDDDADDVAFPENEPIDDDAACDDDDGVEREFEVRRTGMPDVYELLQDDGRPALIAGVPTLRASRAMLDAFAGMPGHATARMTFAFSRTFGKWVPCV